MAHTLFRFALLGLGIGALYGVIAQGLVLIYRGSGVLNFAQGAFVMVGAYTYYELTTKHDLPLVLGVAVAPLVGAVVGALTHRLVLRPMRASSPLARVIATLAVLVTLQSAAVLRYGVETLGATSLLPTRPVNVISGAPVGLDRLLVLLIGSILTAGLFALYRFTAFGRITSAVAENQRAAASLGHSPDRIAVANWALGGALAAFVGALIGPITFLQPTALSILVVPALAAALVGGFRSFPIAFAAALAIGVAQAWIQRYVMTPGVGASVPFLVLIGVMILRGTALPLRSFVLDKLPPVGDGRIRTVPVLATATVVGFLFMNVLAVRWVDALTVTMVFAVLCLSVVVVTGYGGQLSLAQYVLAGVGAFAAAKFATTWNMPFLLSLLGAVVLTALIGAVVGVPALRTRGVNLAVATLGLAIVGFSLVLSNYEYTGGAGGILVDPPSLFGWDIDAIRYPRRYAIVVLVALVAVSVAVANIRRGATGRRLLAVRSNERAAAALGVDVSAAKIYAFSLGSGIAAMAGVLLSFRASNVISSQFDAFTSITTVGMAVVGGVGFIGGAFFGATLLPGGIGTEILRDQHGLERYLPLVGGLFLLHVLRSGTTGLYDMNRHLAHQIGSLVTRPWKAIRARTATAQPPKAATAAEPRRSVTRVVPRRLQVEGLRVTFGGVVAVDGVSFDVRPGEVHGLIGPNGAGKTTVVDAVTGFVRPAAGVVRLDDADLGGLKARRRARAGMARSFQSLELFADLTIRENLAVASDDGSGRRYLTDLVHPGPVRLSDAAHAALHDFELTAHLDEKPDGLSFGRRRLVGIARAIAASPSILLLDEPASGLDDRESKELAGLIRRLADEWGMGILLIEHNTDLVLSVCDRVTVLAGGRVLKTGTPDEVRIDPEVLSVYLGSARTEAASAAEPATPGDPRLGFETAGARP